MASAREVTRVRDAAVEIRGLRELQRGLTQASPDFVRLLGLHNRRIVEVFIAVPARSLAESLGRGQVHLARAGVITSGGTAKSATIKLNATAAHPDALAEEFGRKQTAGWLRWRLVRGHQSVLDTFGQFRPWRGNANESTWSTGTDGAGYALWPTIRRQQPLILEQYYELTMKAFSMAFPEVE